MRTLESKTLLRIFYLCLLVFGGTFLLGTGVMAEEGNKTEGLVLMILCLVPLLYSGLWIRYQMKANKIVYGSDKIFIYRRSGDISHIRTTKIIWKRKFDCVDLGEILSYGYTKEILGHNLELHQFNVGLRPHDGEMFFMLMSGKKVPLETLYLSKKQLKELVQFVYSKTGILPEGSLRKMLK